jgi:hypothetical protein
MVYGMLLFLFYFDNFVENAWDGGTAVCVPQFALGATKKLRDFKFLQHLIGRIFSLMFQGLVSVIQGGASTRPIQGCYSFPLSGPTYRLLLARNTTGVLISP